MALLHNTQKATILKNARKIVIVGLSPQQDKISYQVGAFLLSRGYDSIPIYPRGGEILGREVFCSLNDAFAVMAQNGEVCDIINIFRKSEALGDVMNEICALTPYSSFDKSRLCVWVQLGLQSKEAYQKAKENAILYEEDSCIQATYKNLFGNATLTEITALS